MSNAIFIILILAPIYFAWESIVAPSIRLYLRFRIFKLRDELRQLKSLHGKAFEDEAFRYAQDSFNTAIRLLPMITISVAHEAKLAFDNDASLRARVANREALLESCTIVEVKTIRDKAFHCVALALLVNCAGLFVLVIPAAILALFFNRCKKQLKQLITVPGNEIDRLLVSGRLEPCVA
jgi:hypothetical protein